MTSPQPPNHAPVFNWLCARFAGSPVNSEGLPFTRL